jgi:hypothetical protein
MPQDAGVAHAIGHRIADRYLVRGLLGRGGTAAVYRLVDENTQAERALKQLLVPETTNIQRAIPGGALE